MMWGPGFRRQLGVITNSNNISSLRFFIPLKSNLNYIRPNLRIQEFDGVDDYVDVGDAFDVGTNDFSYECLVYPTKSSIMILAASKQSLTANRWFLDYGNTTNAFRFFTNSGSNTEFSSSASYPPNNWYKVLITRTGSIGKIYVNDVLDNTGTTGSGDIGSASEGSIGRTTSTMEGTINYAKIWLDITQTTLSSYWDLTKSNIGLDGVKDLSGNGNHGTSMGKGEFTRTTDGTVIDHNGVIQTVGTDIARFEGARWDETTQQFYNTDDSGNKIPNSTLKGILSYEGATNEVLYSEDFSNAVWSIGSESSVTLNQLDINNELKGVRVSYDGLGSTINQSGFSQSITVSGGTASKVLNDSFYLKSFDGTTQTLRIKNTQGGVADKFKEISVGANWERFDFTVTNSASVGTGEQIIQILAKDTTTDYDVIMCKPQLNTGSFPMPYIKTEATAVQTTADVVKYDVSGIITQSIGKLESDVIINGVNTSATPVIFDLSDETANNRIYAYVDDSFQVNLRILSGGVEQVLITSTNILTAGTSAHITATYETNSVKLYLNGVLEGTDTSATIPTGLKTLNTGCDYNSANQLNGTLKEVKYYNKIN